MTTSVQQMFVQSSNRDEVSMVIQEYVDQYSNKFIQCSSVLLQGVQQVLAALIRKKREFRLFTSGDWTVVWEIVDHTDFVDPSVARFISKRLHTEAIWVKIDYDYNIWAFQDFQSGDITSEAFLPDSYFNGFPESQHRYDYGACSDQAEAFNASKSLPLFLETIPSIERQPTIARNVSKLICKISATA